MNIEKDLKNLIRANAGVIQIVSYETLRIQAPLVNILGDLKRELYVWNRVEGIKKWTGSDFVSEAEAREPSIVFDFFKGKDHIILLLEDFHPFLGDAYPDNIKRIRNIAFDRNRFPHKTLILSQPIRLLPRELEKEVHVIELPYPDYDDIKEIYKQVCRRYKISNTGEPDKRIIEAILGLTINEGPEPGRM